MNIYTKNMNIMLFEIFVISITILSVYAGCIDNGFVYDDFSFISDNPYVKNLSAWKEFFTNKTALCADTHFVYRPLRTLSFAFDFMLFGNNPAGFHATNIILHLLNSILIYFLAFQILCDTRACASSSVNALAFLTALFFALHPVQSETVNWISCRGDLLFSFFLIAALLLYMLWRKGNMNGAAKTALFIGSHICFLLSLLAKETAVILPVALLLVDAICMQENFFKNKKWLIGYSGYLFILLLYFLTRLNILGRLSQTGYYGGSFYMSSLVMFIAIGRYILLMFFPAALHVVYSIPLPVALYDSRLLFSFFAVIALIWLFQKTRITLFAMCWFFIFLLPVLNIFPIRGLMAEHFLYLSVFGGGLIFSYCISFIFSGRYKVLTAVCVFSIMVLFASMVVERNRDWFDNLSLWGADLRNAPVESYMANTCYGIELGKRGNYEEAIEYLKRALNINYNYKIAHYSLALCYAKKTPPDYGLSKKYALTAKELGYVCDPAFFEYVLRQADVVAEKRKVPEI